MHDCDSGSLTCGPPAYRVIIGLHAQGQLSGQEPGMNVLQAASDGEDSAAEEYAYSDDSSSDRPMRQVMKKGQYTPNSQFPRKL